MKDTVTIKENITKSDDDYINMVAEEVLKAAITTRCNAAKQLNIAIAEQSKLEEAINNNNIEAIIDYIKGPMRANNNNIDLTKLHEISIRHKRTF